MMWILYVLISHQNHPKQQHCWSVWTYVCVSVNITGASPGFRAHRNPTSAISATRVTALDTAQVTPRTHPREQTWLHACPALRLLSGWAKEKPCTPETNTNPLPCATYVSVFLLWQFCALGLYKLIISGHCEERINFVLSWQKRESDDSLVLWIHEAVLEATAGLQPKRVVTKETHPLL